MDIILDYVKPELLVVAIALYFIGKALKNTKTFKDEHIPLALGGIGILLCALYVLSTEVFGTYNDIFAALFTAIVQGVLNAGLSVYVDQLLKQPRKGK